LYIDLTSISFGFLQVPASSILVSLYNEDGSSIACARIAFKEDGHSVSLLHTSITLINTCKLQHWAIGKDPIEAVWKILGFYEKFVGKSAQSDVTWQCLDVLSREGFKFEQCYS